MIFYFLQAARKSLLLSNFKGPLLKRARTRALLHAAKENGRRRPSTEIGIQTYCGNSVDHRSSQKPSVPSLTFSPPCAAFLRVVFRRYEGVQSLLLRRPDGFGLGVGAASSVLGVPLCNFLTRCRISNALRMFPGPAGPSRMPSSSSFIVTSGIA